MKICKVFKSFMYSDHRGLALLETSRPCRWILNRRGAFIQNAILINSKGRLIKNLYLKPKTTLNSYVADIIIEGNDIFLVDFRGYYYKFDVDDEEAVYHKSVEKY